MEYRIPFNGIYGCGTGCFCQMLFDYGGCTYKLGIIGSSYVDVEILFGKHLALAIAIIASRLNRGFLLGTNNLG